MRINRSAETKQSVIAILKSDNKLKAVELFKQNGTSKILWTQSSMENDLDWQSFAAKCGLFPTITPEEDFANNKNVVVGYDSQGTAFYLLNVPAVEEKEISTIVHMQAESRLPLPSDQMELAWRANKLANNQMAVTIAAARRQQVQKFIDKVKFLHPERAILDSEGLVKVWKELFSVQPSMNSGREPVERTSASSAEPEQNTVIINAGTHNTQICLTKNGLLCNAVTLDIGTIDLRESDSQEETETIERLIQDTRSVIDLFGVEKQDKVPVIILTDGSKIYETLADSLKSSGLNTRLATPSIKKIKQDNKLDLKEIFEYRAPIGLALMALDGENDELNLFAKLFKPLREKAKKHWYFNPLITSAIAVVMLMLFAAVSYAVVASGSIAISKKLNNLDSATDINLLVEKQKFLKEIAGQRTDLLELINEITKSAQSKTNTQSNPGMSGAQNPNPSPRPAGQSGIQLDSFHFKKKQKVTITGLAQTKEQLENLEKNLTGNKDFKDVYITSKPNTGSAGNRNQGGSRGSGNISRGNPQSPPMGSGGPGGPGNKGFTFTITFNYKNFTAGKSR